jgi:hypothetical protein
MCSSSCEFCFPKITNFKNKTKLLQNLTCYTCVTVYINADMVVVILINTELILGEEMYLNINISVKKVVKHYYQWLLKYKSGTTSTEDSECLRCCFWSWPEMYIRGLSHRDSALEIFNSTTSSVQTFLITSCILTACKILSWALPTITSECGSLMGRDTWTKQHKLTLNKLYNCSQSIPPTKYIKHAH